MKRRNATYMVLTLVYYTGTIFGRTQELFRTGTWEEDRSCFRHAFQSVDCFLLRASQGIETVKSIREPFKIASFHLITSIVTMDTCSCKTENFAKRPTWQRTGFSTTICRRLSSRLPLSTWTPLKFRGVSLSVSCTGTERSTKARKRLWMKCRSSRRLSSSKRCSILLDHSRIELQRTSKSGEGKQKTEQVTWSSVSADLYQLSVNVL